MPETSDVVERLLAGGDPYSAILDGGNAEAAAAAAKREREVDVELRAQYRACFATPAGRAVLAHLRRVTIEQPCFVPGTELRGFDGRAAEQQGFLREGQNSITRLIEGYLRPDEEGADDA